MEYITSSWLSTRINRYLFTLEPGALASGTAPPEKIPHKVDAKKSDIRNKATQGGADLRFLSPQPDNTLTLRVCETTDTELVYSAVCPFTPQLSLVLTAPTHGGMARLS